LAGLAPVKRRSGEHGDEDAHQVSRIYTREIDLAEERRPTVVKTEERKS
jgi:hypothetical protein